MILITSFAYAQKKEITKTDKLLQKGQSAKLKKYIQGLRKKDHKSAIPDYLVSKSSYHSFKTSGHEKHLHKSLSYLKKSARRSKKESLNWDQPYVDSVYFYARNQYEDFHEEHVSKRKFYGSCLIYLFNDSIHIYNDNPKGDADASKISEAHPDLKEAALREDLTKFAEQFVGTPYKWAGEKPEDGGFDCSGFVLYVFKNYNIELPHKASMISKMGKAVSLQNLRPGDVVAFGKPNVYHIGIIYQTEGELKVIHSVSRGVIIDPLGPEAYWHKNINQFRRLIE